MFFIRSFTPLILKKPLISSNPILRRIVSSTFPDIPVTNKTIGNVIFEYCDKYSDKIACIDYCRNISYSYSDIKNLTIRIAGGLIKKGVQQEWMAIIIATNSPEYIMVLYALSLLGCPVSICNPNYTSKEIEIQMLDSRPSIIFTDDICFDKVLRPLSKLSSVKNVFLIGNKKQGYINVEELINDSGNLNSFYKRDINLENDLAVMPYSSGTTGLPKGIILTHKNIVSYFHQIKISHEFSNQIVLISLPLSHVYTIMFMVNLVFASGSTMVIVPKFEPISFLSAIDKYKISALHLVPSQILFLLNNPVVSNYNLSSVQTCISAAAPLNSEIENRFFEKFQIKQSKFNTYQAYGLSETTGASLIRPNMSKLKGKDGSIGTLISNIQSKIVDVESREELPSNHEGEILLRGPNIMKGYFNNPKESQNAFENGWFRTGDIGTYDDDHYFYITDRLKELIKVGGQQVSPVELETLLMSIKGVEDCGVVGVPHERYGEVPKAFIVRNGDIDKTKIHDLANENLSKHKQFSGGIVFVDKIPRNASGKILRRFLKDI